MKVVRLFSGPDNESHFEDLDIPYDIVRDGGKKSKIWTATSIFFRERGEVLGDSPEACHNAGRRQFSITLKGDGDIEVGDGSKRHFGPGDILLAEDLTGRGHISRTFRSADGSPRESVFITLE